MPEADPAATVLALRPASSGFEVLMVHRNSRGFFGDITVFPGGKVDEIDAPRERRLDDDVSHRHAAIRELAEETGILITSHGPIQAPDVRDGAYYRWIEEQGIITGVDDLVLVSRWVTPESAPRRFDTRFYVVPCPDPPDVAIDEAELIGHEWVTPWDALSRHERGQLAMIRPTLAHLRWLGRWSTVDEAMLSAEGADGRTLIVPRMVGDGSLLPIDLPAELP